MAHTPQETPDPATTAAATTAADTAADTPEESADVIVVGAGPAGSTTAYHLARAGVTDVVLIEKSEFGAGSTCKAAGGVRAQFSDAVNIELGARSLHAFETFKATFDQEIDLHQVGYLFLLEDPEHPLSVRLAGRPQDIVLRGAAALVLWDRLGVV